MASKGFITREVRLEIWKRCWTECSTACTCKIMALYRIVQDFYSVSFVILHQDTSHIFHYFENDCHAINIAIILRK